MRRILIPLLCALYSRSLPAQNPGQHVAVDVQITSVARSSDTIGVSYVVSSLPSSSELLGRFAVDVPGGVLRITTPSPTDQWDTDTTFNGRSLAHWVGGMIPAGSSTPELHFDAVGIPAIVTYWVGGVFVFPSREEPDNSPETDPFVAEMINGKTVGVEPWPTDRTSHALIARLRLLTQTSCAAPLLWVNSADLCSQLVSNLDQAESFRAGGQSLDARNSLNAFISAISGSTPGAFAPGVNSLGYWLLKTNAEIVLSVL